MNLLLPVLAGCIEDKAGMLLERLRSQDPQALADLYDRYGRIVYVVILRIVNHPGVAEDLVQESFLRAWNRASSLKTDYGSVGPWLLSIARHCALDYRRSPQFQLAGQVTVDEAWVAPVMIEDDLLTAERSRALEEAFLSLTENQRRVIRLAYYEGLSQAEIAEQLHQPLGTVKGWTRAALQRLRNQVDHSLMAPA
jgi:RNA polymerase sigma-70 factor (ECF subfamily)